MVACPPKGPVDFTIECINQGVTVEATKGVATKKAEVGKSQEEIKISDLKRKLMDFKAKVHNQKVGGDCEMDKQETSQQPLPGKALRVACSIHALAVALCS